jgi:orsellinic acid C2-O-methyltransferase
MVLYQLGTGFYVSQALYVAAKLGIADHLAAGPQTAEALARATGTHAPSLRRVLHLLTSAGVFAEDAEGRFSSTAIGACMRDGPGSFRSAVLLFAGPGQWASWGDLGTTVRTGEPALSRVSGCDPFEYFAQRPEEAAIFDQAMSAFTAMTAVAVAEAYDFSALRSLADVGGGNGTLLAGLLRARPHLRGAVLDLPRLGDAARRTLSEAGLGDRCEFVGGDFFESVPGGHDAYLLKHVIHDWDDERARRILTNVRRAMKRDAKALIVEGIYPARIDTSPASRGAVANDCNMLVATGGRQRTEEEFRALLAAAGLRLTRIVPTRAMTCVIEAAPVQERG